MEKYQVFEEDAISELKKHLSSNLSVKRHQRVKGKSGALRELDLLIEDNTSTPPLKAVVECKYYKRMVGVADIESLWGLVDDVSGDLGIMICNERYTQNAIKRAGEIGHLMLFTLLDLQKDDPNIELALKHFLKERRSNPSRPISQERISSLSKLYDYSVALSYAGEDRKYAQELADILKSRGLKVFYDQYEKPILWGKDLYTHLSDVYQNKAFYCLIFISQHYANKIWTKHELQAAQARALKENREYILPIRLDNTEVPGILSTISYLSWPPENAETIADAITDKLYITKADAIDAITDKLYITKAQMNAQEYARCTQVVQQTTPRELDVLRAFAKGLSQLEVVQELGVSPRTIDGYKTKLLEKCRSVWAIEPRTRLGYHFLYKTFALYFESTEYTSTE